MNRKAAPLENAALFTAKRSKYKVHPDDQCIVDTWTKIAALFIFVKQLHNTSPCPKHSMFKCSKYIAMAHTDET